MHKESNVVFSLTRSVFFGKEDDQNSEQVDASLWLQDFINGTIIDKKVVHYS
jgi:hypothetical protein